MRSTAHRPAFRPMLALLGALTLGCGKSEEYDGPIPTGNAPTTATASDFESKISSLINDLNAKYRPIEYDYAEDLLATLDRVEDRISGKAKTLTPLPLPKLDEAEQLAHFEETFKRWSAANKRPIRAEIDALKADVAARKPGDPPFHPEFQKKFSAAFDSLIPIEVAEIRERRNKRLQAEAKVLMDEYRAKDPAGVKRAEAELSKPEYQVAGS